MQLLKVFFRLALGLVSLTVILLFLYRGVKTNLDYTSHRQFQKFIEQVQTGQKIEDVQHSAESSGFSQGDYFPVWYGPRGIPVEIDNRSGIARDELFREPRQWTPSNLSALLHPGTRGHVKEPCLFWGSSVSRQGIFVFYDPKTREVIGWVSFGAKPMKKE